MKRCCHCDTEFPASARFCSECGAQLPADADPSSHTGGGSVADSLINRSTISSQSTDASARAGSINIQLGSQQSTPEVHVGYCPICGFKEKANSFRCRECGRVGICVDHYVAKYRCCEDCAQRAAATHGATEQHSSEMAAATHDNRGPGPGSSASTNVSDSVDELLDRVEAILDGDGDLGDKADDAIAICRQAITMAPDSSRAHLLMGLAYYTLERYEDAIGEYRQAIRLNPNDYAAHRNLGDTYCALERDEDAIGEYRQAIRLNPNDAVAHRRLAQLYDEIFDDHENAVKSYTDAVAADPSDPELRYLLGMNLIRTQDYEGARRQLRRLRETDDDEVYGDVLEKALGKAEGEDD